jgi:Holliday junction DNA helicase RuvB
LDYYESAELERVVSRSASLLGLEIHTSALNEIASRSRGTPRIANRLLRRVRDFAEVNGSDSLSHQHALDALTMYEVDELGLDRLDRAVMLALIDRFAGGPVGLSTLAIAVGEESETVESVAEPFLVRNGLMARTPRGRVATEAGYRHLGRTPPAQRGTLFDTHAE